MSRGTVLVLIAPLVVSLFGLSVNFTVWRHGRRELAHRSLALACLAGALVLLATALVYASGTVGEAVVARSAFYLCLLPLTLGGVRQLERKQGRSLPTPYRLAAALPALWAIVGFVPGLLHADGLVPRGSGPLGISYTDVELTALGSVAPLTVLLSPLAVLWRIGRTARSDADRAAILAVGLVSNLSAASDLLVLGGWIDAPFLLAITFTATTVVYSARRLRRFVGSLERVEASADLLQRAAERRAAELREIDLRLAHGARLAALGTLAAGLAHEINNPAAFVRSNLTYLMEHADDPEGDPERAEVLQETAEGVERLRAIVDELLRMSAHREADFGDVRLGDVVESALPALRFEAGGGIEIDARLAPVPAVRGDRNLLGQVVTNLAINAIQAVRGAGGRGGVRIATFAETDRVVLEVTDTGPGIPSEVAQRIFEPFFTTKPAGEGTGLGLAVTRQLVERHGGRLVLLPSPAGARFRVELPIVRERTSGNGARNGAPLGPLGPA